MPAGPTAAHENVFEFSHLRWLAWFFAVESSAPWDRLHEMPRSCRDLVRGSGSCGQKNSIRQNHQQTLTSNIAIAGLQWRCLRCSWFHFYPCGCRPVSRFLFADSSGLCPPISLIAWASHLSITKIVHLFHRKTTKTACLLPSRAPAADSKTQPEG